MWGERLRAAGSCSIGYAVLSAPSVVVGVLAREEGWGSPAWLADVFLTTVTLALWTYSASTLSGLLARIGAPSDVRDALGRYVWANIASTVVFTLPPLPVGMVRTLVAITLAVAVGIFGLLFAVEILRLRQDLFGLREAFGYTHLATDICLVSCVFAILAIPLAISNNVILAVILFRAANAEKLPHTFE